MQLLSALQHQLPCLLLCCPAAVILFSSWTANSSHLHLPCLCSSQPADDDLLVSHQVVSLKDPMSGQRMQVGAGAEGRPGAARGGWGADWLSG